MRLSETQDRRQLLIRYSMGFGVCVLAAALLLAANGSDRSTIDKMSLDEANLSLLHAGIQQYYLDHAKLPTPSELKMQLLECKLVEDESVFYSGPSRVEVRYYTSDTGFALVSPGANGRYDTPESYEALLLLQETGDDLLKFGRVGGKLKHNAEFDGAERK